MVLLAFYTTVESKLGRPSLEQYIPSPHLMRPYRAFRIQGQISGPGVSIAPRADLSEICDAPGEGATGGTVLSDS